MLAFDIETTGLDPHRAQVTVVCTEDFYTGEKKAYEFARLRKHEPQNLPSLTAELIQAFESAESLCAFNGIRFDLPFLHTALNLSADNTGKWMAKCSDILEACRLQCFGPKHTFGLNALCGANDIMQKSSCGLEAIQMAEAGRWDDLNAYCHDDVSILCKLYRRKILKNPRKHQAIELSKICHENMYSTTGMLSRLENIRTELTSDCAIEQLNELKSFLRERDAEQLRLILTNDEYKKQVSFANKKIEQLTQENSEFTKIFAEF